MSKIVDIWNPKTGITELSDRDRSAPVPELYQQEWDIDDICKGHFGHRNNIAAIETGQIEGVYDIEDKRANELVDNDFEEWEAEELNAIKIIKDQRWSIQEMFSFVDQDKPLTLHAIKALHKELTLHQKYVEGVDQFGNPTKTPIARGVWKLLENNPSNRGNSYHYCPPAQVQQQMEKLLEMHAQHVEDGKEGGLDTLIAAAWLHHRFVQIHPFQDGNGRMARLLATHALLDGGLSPFVVLRQHRSRYIFTLGEADAGDLAPLIRFMGEAQFYYMAGERPNTYRR